LETDKAEGKREIQANIKVIVELLGDVLAFQGGLTLDMSSTGIENFMYIGFLIFVPVNLFFQSVIFRF